ncbi:MAG TPA: tetratricopeptide repeat protein [Methanothrix sp.]|nr:tetratricopeptide repeat protein [Methanothrix sp.]HRW83080.1 tetratricopeptide repeat protein [Methanothrix sp.]
MKSKEKILVHKGMDRVKRREFEEALGYFDEVLETNPKNSDAWNNKGVALFQMGRTEEALVCYDQALAADAENREALRNKAFVLRALERFDEAVEVYEMIITDEPEASDFRNLATVLVGMGLLEEALGALMDAANLEPSISIEREIEVLRRVIMEVAVRAEFGGVFPDGTGADRPGEG